LTRYGRLYEIQNWVLSKESTSSLAWTPAELESHFLPGQEDAQQRLLLATARVMAGDATFQQSTQALVRRVLHARAWTDQDTRTLLAHRHQLEQTASERNLKRGPGGTLDVEMLSQILSMEQTHRDAHFLAPGTMESLERLKRCGRIAGDDALALRDAYNFLRGVESGLRLMNTKARHDLPNEPLELARLAYGLHVPDAPQLLDACEHYRHEVRRLFHKYLPDH
jgi:glutamate-ammonia-ligase adenylyltransferase